MEKRTQVQEAKRVPGRISPRRSTLGLTVIKLAKIKDGKKKKASRGKQQVTYKGIPIRLSSTAFSAETLQARKSGTYI